MLDFLVIFRSPARFFFVQLLIIIYLVYRLVTILNSIFGTIIIVKLR